MGLQCWRLALCRQGDSELRAREGQVILDAGSEKQELTA